MDNLEGSIEESLSKKTFAIKSKVQKDNDFYKVLISKQNLGLSDFQIEIVSGRV